MGLMDFASSLPVVGSLFDNSQAKGQGAIADAAAQFQGLKLPDLQWQNYAPGAVTPEMAQGSQIQDDPLVKSAQLAALAKMGDLANTGLSAADQQGYEQARELGNQTANAGTQAAMQNAISRGVAGSGSELAMREVAAQGGAQRAQQAGLQTAADSAKQRAMFNTAYSTALGNQRTQDLKLNADNTGILNQFNMANTQNRNAAQQYNVGNQNQAQLINQQGRTGIAQENYDNAYKKAGGVAGADYASANNYAAQNANNTNAQNGMMQAGIGAYTAFGGGAAKKPSANSAGGSNTDFGGYA